MNNLIKANFYKLKNDKKTFVILGLSLLIGMTVIISKIIISYFMPNQPELGVIVEALKPNCKKLFLSGISLSENIGILFPLCISLFIGAEFSQNTIRNKIITGHSKTNIYLSNLVMSVVLGLAIYATYQLSVLSIGLPLFGWAEKFVLAEFIQQLTISLLIIITYSALTNFVSMLSKSLVLSLIINLIGTIFLSIIFASLPFLPVKGLFREIIDFIMQITVFGQSILIQNETSLSLLICTIVSSLITFGGLTALGCFLFEKSDIK